MKTILNLGIKIFLAYMFFTAYNANNIKEIILYGVILFLAFIMEALYDINNTLHKILDLFTIAKNVKTEKEQQ